MDLPWMDGINRPAAKRRIPSVLTKDEVAGLLAQIALEQKYPKVGQTWGWFWMFPSPTLSIDPRSGVAWQHHLFERP